MEMALEAGDPEAAQLLAAECVIEPPEEKKDVKTAIGAARAKAARKKSLRAISNGDRRSSPLDRAHMSA